jgi:hypothetical protein
MRDLDRTNNPILQLRKIYKGALPFLSELIDNIEEALRDSDVLVSSYLFPNYKAIAERQGKPFISFAFCHNTIPSPNYPPELVPSLTWRSAIHSVHLEYGLLEDLQFHRG